MTLELASCQSEIDVTIVDRLRSSLERRRLADSSAHLLDAELPIDASMVCSDVTQLLHCDVTFVIVVLFCFQTGQSMFSRTMREDVKSSNRLEVKVTSPHVTATLR